MPCITFLNTYVQGHQSVAEPTTGQVASGIPGPEALQVSQVEQPSTGQVQGDLAEAELKHK